jgi:tetratricopeptide (TPR) repeat protein
VIDLAAEEAAESARDAALVAASDARAPSGRADEVARLTGSARDGVLAGELRAVLVTAPPGAGKTWLVDEAASRLERAGSKVVRAVCSPARGDVRVVGSWLLDLGRDAGGVRELAFAAGPAPGAALLRATGLTRGGEVDVDPAVVADAMVTVLAHAAPANAPGVEPIVCIVEDLHHASLELLDLLSRLAMRTGIAGALWCTTRPNWVDADDLGFEVLALGPLDPEAIAALVGDLDGAAGSTQPVEEILAVAGGNPLHAREAALALRRGESLDDQSSLPELIAARFATFEPPLRAALGLAAACGDDFWPEALGGQFLEAVPDLYRAGIAQARMSSTLPASTEARFRHPLLREVAYASLDDSRRRRLHAELGRALDQAGAPAEIVAGQAGTAFRLGERDVAPLAARSAAEAGREALDRVSLQAASEWITLLRETGGEAEPGVADLLDTELALDRGEYQRARTLVGTEPEHRPLAARRLVLATRAAYGTGDLADAARYGERALTLLADEPLEAASHAATYGVVLSRIGRHEEALAIMDKAADDARVRGERGLAARLAAEAADVACVVHRSEGTYFTDAIARARLALAEIRLAGDRRRYIASVPAFVAILYIDSPEEALELAVDGAQQAIELGDLGIAGALAIAICDTALEAEADDVLDEWLPRLTSFPLDVTQQIEAEVQLVMARAARSRESLAMDAELLRLADRYAELGDVTKADTPEIGALCNLAWIGRPEAARLLLDTRVRDHLPPQFATLYDLVLRAIEGPPWSLDGLDLPETTLPHYERALLHVLRGEQPAADTLFRERYQDRRRVTGSGRQRFSPYFPGALVAALGPSDTEPDIGWLLDWIHRPRFPGLWIAHRAICALLLSERIEPPQTGLDEVAVRLISSTDAEASVRRWISERAARSRARRDRGV